MVSLTSRVPQLDEVVITAVVAHQTSAKIWTSSYEEKEKGRQLEWRGERGNSWASSLSLRVERILGQRGEN